jgi:hypothetical protein
MDYLKAVFVSASSSIMALHWADGYIHLMAILLFFINFLMHIQYTIVPSFYIQLHFFTILSQPCIPERCQALLMRARHSCKTKRTDVGTRDKCVPYLILFLQILINIYSLLNFQKKMRKTRGLGRNGKSFPTLQ